MLPRTCRALAVAGGMGADLNAELTCSQEKHRFFVVGFRVGIFSFCPSRGPAELYSIFKNGEGTKIASCSVREPVIVELAGGRGDSRSCRY